MGEETGSTRAFGKRLVLFAICIKKIFKLSLTQVFFLTFNHHRCLSMKTQNFISRFVFLTVLFASLFGSSLYAKPLTNDEKAKRKKEVVAMLSGTTWDVELFPMDDPKKKPIKDVVSYEHGRLKSKAFAVEGYSESNLTVTIEDDGKAIWETMQSHATKGPIFWRGELAEKTVNGVLSRQNKDGSTDAYSLRGVQSGTFEVAPEEKPVIIEAPKEVVPPAVVPAAAVAAPAAVNALDALLGKAKAPAAGTPAVTTAAVPAKAAVPAAASAAVKPAVVAATPAVKSAVPVATKPVTASVQPAAVVAAVKTEAKPAVQAVADSAEKKKKEKKSKWSW